MPDRLVSSAEIRSDFDRIALLPDGGWDHNSHYHAFLLEHVPVPCREALDISCGAGAFTRLLAERAGNATALDLSPNMIRIAGERSGGCANIHYEVADAATWEIPPGRFDCIVSLATFHHLPFEAMLAKIKPGLAPHGRLIVLDLYRAESLADLAVNLVAFPTNVLLRLVKGSWVGSASARQAWAEHGRHDTYQTLSQVRRSCAQLLPGAQIRRHLLWRYSLIWEKKDD